MNWVTFNYACVNVCICDASRSSLTERETFDTERERQRDRVRQTETDRQTDGQRQTETDEMNRVTFYHNMTSL